jgi:hypothetical protein
MATKTGTSKPEPVGTAILEQLADIDVRSLSPETARKLLELRFDATHHARVNDLSAKAQEGTITPAEGEELDEYLRVADLLAILQSRARQALNDAGVTS